MKYLFFDTETTGMVLKNRPYIDDAQPKIVQIAAMLCNESGDVMSMLSTLIDRPELVIPLEAERIHGKSVEACKDFGSTLVPMLQSFHQMLVKADLIIAHNSAFDIQVLRNELRRIQSYVTIDCPTYCTMLGAKDILKLPGKYGGYKWPSLVETYTHFFGAAEEVHDALHDVRMCKDIFFKLKELGHVGNHIE